MFFSSGLLSGIGVKRATVKKGKRGAAARVTGNITGREKR